MPRAERGGGVFFVIIVIPAQTDLDYCIRSGRRLSFENCFTFIPRKKIVTIYCRRVTGLVKRPCPPILRIPRVHKTDNHLRCTTSAEY